MKKTVEKGTVMEKKIPEIFINGKHAMAMRDINQFKGHTGSAIHGILISAGSAKTAVTAKRNKFEFPTMRAAVHGTAERRITTVYHFINIFHLSFSGMKGIFYFLIIVGKDFL